MPGTTLAVRTGRGVVSGTGPRYGCRRAADHVAGPRSPDASRRPAGPPRPRRPRWWSAVGRCYEGGFRRGFPGDIAGLTVVAVVRLAQGGLAFVSPGPRRRPLSLRVLRPARDDRRGSRPGATPADPRRP